MNHYIDIQLKPDAEMRENVLLNKVYTKLHKALFDLKSSDIAVSFPKYDIRLGDVLRIHSSKLPLEELQNQNWLGGLSGYCDISPISKIPESSSHRTISRIQTTMSAAKLRRLIKKGTISAADLKRYKAKMFAQSLDNPYLELESSSNGHQHRRFIEFGKIVTTPIHGQFDQFGLSKTATVPWF